MDELFGDHGHDETAIESRLGGKEGVKAKVSHGTQDGFNGPMRQRLFNAEQSAGRGKGLILEQSSEGLDLMVGPMGEIGQGAFDDLVALPCALSQQNGGPRVSIGYGFDIHGNILSGSTKLSQENKEYLHGNK